MGIRTYANKVIRSRGAKEGGSGKAGVAALREHRAANKASGSARKSGWRKRWPEWLKVFIYGKGAR